MKTHHEPFCINKSLSVTAKEVPYELIVIDVVEMKLQKISWQEKYFTLSYVWGKNNVNYRATSEHWEQLHTPGSIEKLL